MPLTWAVGPGYYIARLWRFAKRSARFFAKPFMIPNSSHKAMQRNMRIHESKARRFIIGGMFVFFSGLSVAAPVRKIREPAQVRTSPPPATVAQNPTED